MKTITYLIKGLQQLQHLSYITTDYLDEIHWDKFDDDDFYFHINYNVSANHFSLYPFHYEF